MQFEKFNNPQPYTEHTSNTEIKADSRYYDIQYEKTEAEIPALRSYPYNSYVGNNPCPGWHAPVNKRPDDIEAEIKKWFTKGVVALFILYGLILVGVLALKVFIAVWAMK